MLEIIKAGGWLMLPILTCSIIALAIIGERFWTLRQAVISPAGLVEQVWGWIQNKRLEADKIRQLRQQSPLGQILAAGLINANRSREIMRESVEETGRHVVHQLERYLNTLGTIATIAPLLGLLGTVIGMIDVFSAITAHGVGNAAILAGGISQALITTATGLAVAIPTLIMHRHFERKIDSFVLQMEQDALRLVEMLNSKKEQLQAGRDK